MSHLIDVFLHLDKYLYVVMQEYGVCTYSILCLIIFLAVTRDVTAVRTASSQMLWCCQGSSQGAPGCADSNRIGRILDPGPPAAIVDGDGAPAH
jgi:hypothetical protein